MGLDSLWLLPRRPPGFGGLPPNLVVGLGGALGGLQPPKSGGSGRREPPREPKPTFTERTHWPYQTRRLTGAGVQTFASLERQDDGGSPADLAFSAKRSANAVKNEIGVAEHRLSAAAFRCRPCGTLEFAAGFLEQAV